MAREYYDQPITATTKWGGDASTGGLQVKGNRVQEWIKDQVTRLDEADAAINDKITLATQAEVEGIVDDYAYPANEVETEVSDENANDNP